MERALGLPPVLQGERSVVVRPEASKAQRVLGVQLPLGRLPQSDPRVDARMPRGPIALELLLFAGGVFCVLSSPSAAVTPLGIRLAS